jgi:uncharacterized protein YcaQ
MDSINVLERAHHLILGSRLEGYDPGSFEALLHPGRALFEQWTHDASAIPVAFYPHWKVRFPRSRVRILASPWWRERVGDQVDLLLASVLDRVRREGPLRSADFEHDRQGVPSGWWGWKPQKAALEFLWHTGELAVARREHFHKVYDLAERVLPGPCALAAPDPQAHLEWACATALERLGVATPRELAAFWNAVDPAQASRWCAQALEAGRIQQVAVDCPGGPPRLAFALPDAQDRVPEATGPMALLCPFDPILRDRARAQRLFGFDYRFEAFVPGPKRQFGYYVMPILDGDALVGRLDPKFHRDRGLLAVQGLWWEPGVRGTKARLRKLEKALEGLAQRIGARSVELPPAP